ncbi:MAG: hypothetical protein KKA55_01020 [Proteobacteria bacterium]|nr:hypothetical protein [Pseudomonadota bacterium]MBU1594099.1 hypothetical protein [Pseudomonadota bacterium]
MDTERRHPAEGGAPEEPVFAERRGLRALGGAGLLALCLGLAAGLVLYLPWDTIWTQGLKRYGARHPELHLTWQNVDRAGPLSFRINGLSIEPPGWSVSPRMQWVDVRLGVTPQLTLRLDSGGREARLLYFDTGSFDLGGQVNLACLGRRDIRGSVDIRAEGLYLRDQDVLARGFLDLRGQSLHMPGSQWLGDAALALEYQDGTLRIRSFTLRAPVQVRAEGTAALRPGSLLGSPYTVSGEIIRGRDTFSFTTAGILGDFLGQAALPE